MLIREFSNRKIGNVTIHRSYGYIPAFDYIWLVLFNDNFGVIKGKSSQTIILEQALIPQFLW
ncbi:hypothetical protein [Moraxella sp.]|uniref:hypothetical protein n=1 Tax=Moraxella sp. TaxID=479 RepID=UPI0026DB390D|nr:hypothetical protein [Moraxella sp.]MDO4894375.1 hypothetical protein [Moraxella sp.]